MNTRNKITGRFEKKWNNPGAHTEYAGLYQSWRHMLERAGNKDGKNPTYLDVSVCDRWFSYDNFFEDMASTWASGLSLDKDIINPGNKIYCKEYCCWISKSENSKERINRLGSPMKNPEVSKKVSEKMTGKSNHKKQVQCIETGEIFKCCRDAEKKYNTPESAVANAANPRRKQKFAAGFTWRYV